jgi:hypothetical protein
MVYFIFYFNILLLFSVQFLTDYKNLRIFGRKIRPWWGPILQFKSLGVNVSKGPIFMTRRNRLYWTASPAQSHGTDEAQLELLAKQVQTPNPKSYFHLSLFVVQVHIRSPLGKFGSIKFTYKLIWRNLPLIHYVMSHKTIHMYF